MFKAFIKKVVGSRHEREAKRLQPVVAEINRIQAQLASLPEDALRGKTEEFRARIRERLGALQDEVGGLRERKRRSEDPEEREQLSLQIAELDKAILDATEEVLDELLPEAFAVVKETCRRLVGQQVMVTGHPLTWGDVPYDVQLIGAIALHDGKVSEMATGEGKTLTDRKSTRLNSSHLVISYAVF